MRRIPAALLLLLLLCAIPLAALDWPVDKKLITATFGEDRGDHFHNGIDLGGGEQEIRAVLPGELVFRYDEGTDASSIPRGVGSFVALHHADNIISIYCHMKRDSLGDEIPRYAAGQKIGIVGDTGHSEGRHLHFIVFDEETASFLNPLSLLPQVPDRQPPVIKRVLLAVGDRLLPLEKGARLPAGQARILAVVQDLREDVAFHWPIAPYSLRMSLNGKETTKIVFDSLQVVEGRMVLSGTSLSSEQVYAADDLIRCGTVELHGGQAHLVISARDFTGNETTREIFFTVDE